MNVDVPDTDCDFLVFNVKTCKWEKDVAVLIEHKDKAHWEVTIVKKLVAFLGLSGNARGKVIAYLLGVKTVDNYIIGSAKTISEKIGVSESTVATTFSSLKKKGYLKEVQRGVSMLHPDILRFGSTARMHILMTKWNKAK